ncbi:MAG: hypothetical protein A2X49_13370 [Lentisphaerae bacterium GWF2_52_8]|nr:MAG: hypothetical protein A2X49_13370 [Lentisphaerae bacterium GWF2_52_8]
MKTLIAISMMLALLATSGCWNTSNQGGTVSVNEKFNITVPSSCTVKQGEETSITITLNRGAFFKRDVQLDLSAEGISLSPSSILVKASDKPEVKIKITAASNAALGESRVSVKGTPSSGQTALTTFTVKIITP